MVGADLHSFSGTFSTAIAVLHFGRSAIAAEEGWVCDGLVVERLRTITLLVIEQSPSLRWQFGKPFSENAYTHP